MKQKTPYQPQKLDIESDKQYFLFIDFFNLGRTRKIFDVAYHFGCSERTIYAYAKKFNWFERARIEDKKQYDREINEEKLKSAEIKLEKIRYLNRAQELANCFMGFLSHSTNNDNFNTYLDTTGGSFTITEKISNVSKVLKSIECYTRICISIDKHLDKLYNEEEGEIHTEESFLEQKEFYEKELEILEKTIGNIEFESIYQEIEYIDKGYKLKEINKEFA